MRFTASRAHSRTSSRSRLTVFAASHRPSSGPSEWSGIMPMFRTAELALCGMSPGLLGITMRSAYCCVGTAIRGSGCDEFVYLLSCNLQRHQRWHRSPRQHCRGQPSPQAIEALPAVQRPAAKIERRAAKQKRSGPGYRAIRTRRCPRYCPRSAPRAGRPTQGSGQSREVPARTVDERVRRAST